MNTSFLKIEKNRRKRHEKRRNDVSDIFTSEDMENISDTPDVVSYKIYEWRILHYNIDRTLRAL